MKITQIDGLTDTVIERVATDAEEAQLIADQSAAQAAEEADQIMLAEKIKTKALLLERLGITAEEAALLLG